MSKKISNEDINFDEDKYREDLEIEYNKKEE